MAENQLSPSSVAGDIAGSLDAMNNVQSCEEGNIISQSSHRSQQSISTGNIMPIDKLEGSSNYPVWKFQMKMLLVDVGLWHVINSPIDCNIVDDQRALAKICLNVSTKVYPYVIHAKSSKEAWNNLLAAYENKGISRRLALKRELYKCNYCDYTSMEAYITNILNLFHQLHDLGCMLEDEELAEILLIGLPEEFDALTMAMEGCEAKLTSDNVIRRLKQGDFRKKELQGMTSNAMVSVKSKRKIICHHCSREGHIRPKCPLLLKSIQKKTTPNIDPDSAMIVTQAMSSYQSATVCDSKEWLVDSGCSTHMSMRKDWMLNYSKQCNSTVTVANNSKLHGSGNGNVKVVLDNNTEKTITDVTFVPGIAANLLSVNKITKKGYILVFDEKQCQAFVKGNVTTNGNCVFSASNINGLYKLNQHQQCPVFVCSPESEVLSPGSADQCAGIINEVQASNDNIELWHKRMGHLSYKGLLLLRNGLAKGIKFKESCLQQCIPCIEGKQATLSFPRGSSRKSTQLLELIHSDLCGPMPVPSWSGNRYILTFSDDFSRKSFVFFLKTKSQSEIIQKFIEFKNLVENQTGLKIKRVRTDNGTEYCNQTLKLFFRNNGIIHETTIPYSPQQNGISERLNRTIMEKARSMLQDSGLDQRYWGEAVLTAVYLKNLSPTAALKNALPEEIWSGCKVDLSHLKVFGCKAYALIPNEKRHKLNAKSKSYIMIGYCENSKGYRLADPLQPGKFIKARNVVFLENVAGICNELTKQQNVINPLIIENEYESIPSCSNLNECISKECTSSGQDIGIDSNDSVSLEDVNQDLSVNKNEATINSVLDSNIITNDLQMENLSTSKAGRIRTRPVWMKDYVTDDDDEIVLLSTDPKTYNEAVSSEFHKEWRLAMDNEYKSLVDKNVWELVERPKNKNIIQCKWVFKEKKDSEGNFEKFKARLVARGFSQKYGIDYNSTFSPVVRHSTLRLLFAIAVQRDMDVEHIDVSTAFLNGELHETIYMEQPTGYEIEGKNKVCLLKKGIYGLKQASRSWNEKVNSILMSIGFKRTKCENCVYSKKCDGKYIIIALYVDDFFIFSEHDVERKSLIETLRLHFEIKELGDVKNCLGLRIERDRENGTLKLSQPEYIRQLLEKYGMSHCKTASTPMQVSFNLTKADKCDKRYPYQELVGALMYLCVCTRPDIAFTCSKLGQFNNSYNITHWQAAKRVLRYLAGTPFHGLLYKRNNSDIKIYADADWANDGIDRKSYTGFCTFYGDCLINWESRKQHTVAYSSTEAEYYSLGESVKESKYLRNFFIDIFDCNLEPIIIYNDNLSTHKIAENEQNHRRTKHIDVRHHFIKDAVSEKIIKLKYKSTDEMTADILTKSLGAIKHRKFVSDFNIVDCNL